MCSLKSDGQCLTLDDISEVTGITKERIRQIEEKALTKIRKSAPSKLAALKSCMEDIDQPNNYNRSRFSSGRVTDGNLPQIRDEYYS